MKKQRFLIVGCGWVAKIHARVLKELGVEFAFADIDRPKAEQYAREFGAVAARGSLEEGLADPEVTGVIVSTPHDLHQPQAAAAAAAGKAILMEKPIARTLGEADRVIEAARAAKVPLVVLEHMRFAPVVNRAAELLRDGAIGKVKSVLVLNFGNLTEIEPWREKAERLGGGALIDSGIHFLSVLLALGGRPERLTAVMPATTLPLEGEDSADVLVEFPGGATGGLHFTWTAPGMMAEFPRFVAYGSEGSLLCRRTELVLARPGRDKETVMEFPNLHDIGVYRAMHEAILKHLAGQGPNPYPGEAGREDLLLVRAAYKSRRLGGPVRLDEVGAED